MEPPEVLYVTSKMLPRDGFRRETPRNPKSYLAPTSDQRLGVRPDSANDAHAEQERHSASKAGKDEPEEDPPEPA